ncbi:YkvA family protein [Fictibacillus iocasae]|uniref:YkvA family protein n=1 Tax=Fictibacillus iocasae TaxID=2715437 RepID=A0ABW2NND3_9BACL
MFKFFKRLKFVLKFWKFIPFLKDYFLTSEVALPKKLFGVGLLAAYAVFPFDIIPDFLIFFGILDEVTLAAFVLQRLVKNAPPSLQEKHGLSGMK